MTGRDVAIVGASLTLQHVPDLVRYGSKPRREQERLPQIQSALRSFSDAVDYPPNQVFIGNAEPDILSDLPRPWWRDAPSGDPRGAFGDIMDQAAFYELLAELDQFELVRLKEEPRPGELPLFHGDEVIGAFAPAHESDESLTAHVLLENLACKAGAVHATRHLLASTGVDPTSIPYVIGAGEEAIGDRYQRGGGNLGKAIAEATGITEASGCDIKAFCAAPIHALVVAGALVSSGVYDRVAVVAGGALGKLGMKFEGALEHDMPILEDVLAGMAILVGAAEDSSGPTIRMDAVGRHRVAAGASQQALLEDIVGAPLDGDGTHDRRYRPVRDRAPQPGDHGVVGRRRRAGPELPDARRARRGARRPDQGGARSVRAIARDAGVLADAGPHRVGDPVAPARVARVRARRAAARRC